MELVTLFLYKNLLRVKGGRNYKCELRAVSVRLYGSSAKLLTGVG